MIEPIISIILSLIFNGFVLYKFFTNPRQWNLWLNPIGFVVTSLILTTQIWAPNTSLLEPFSIFVAFASTILSGSTGIWGWVELIFFMGTLIPIAIIIIGWIMHDMEENPSESFAIPMIIFTRHGIHFIE